MSSLTIEVSPTQYLRGEIDIPGDKSISHRALLLSSIAEGVSQIQGFLFARDNLDCLHALRQLGVRIDENRVQGMVTVHGVGLHGLKASSLPLDMGNSGTAMRLLTGLLAGQGFSSTLIGDGSLSKRPMKRVVMPLTQMGAHIKLTPEGTAPVIIHAAAGLQPISYHLPVASAQLKSALLLAAIYAGGESEISVPAITRNHTEKMLKQFAYPVKSFGYTVTLQGGHPLIANRVQIPADISSAAFFMVAATIVPRANILLRNVGINSTRLGVINILRLMGADIELYNRRFLAEEPVADIQVKSANLRGIDIPRPEVSSAMDELPVILIAAACAKGLTRLTGAAELRVKESDRLNAMEKGLKRLGIACETTTDGMQVQGGRFKGGIIDSFGDHRIAMAFAVAGCVAESEVRIYDCDNIQTSFPGFIELSQLLGFCIEAV